MATFLRIGNLKGQSFWVYLAIGATFLISVALSNLINSGIFYWVAVILIAASALFMSQNTLFVICWSFWVFYPIEYLTLNAMQNFISPASLVLLIYLFKFRKINFRETRGQAGLLVVILALIESANSINLLRSMGWTFHFCLVLFVICTRPKTNSQSDNSETQHVALKTLVGLTLFLGVLAVLEASLGKALIYNGQLGSPFQDSYKWSLYSVFRVQTTLGHPLANGLFFATASVMFLLQWLRKDGNRIFLISFVMAFVSTILSGSRTATYSSLLGMACVILLNWKRSNNFAKVSILLVSPAIILVFSLSPLFQKIVIRAQSGEGISSQSYRFDLITWIQYFIKNYFFYGSGPGTSGYVWDIVGNGGPFENGLFQLWVSLGFMQALALLFLLVYSIIKHFRIGATWAVFIPIISYFPTTNFVDDASNFVIFLGILWWGLSEVQQISKELSLEV